MTVESVQPVVRARPGPGADGGAGAGPAMSVVVIVYRMTRQAMNTLYSLSAAHQREVSPSDYEVIVVENESDSNLDEREVVSLEGDFRYLRRREPGVSPAPAINAGLALCRGRYVGLVIDGARMVTPRVIRYALDAFRITDRAMVVVPGYHLGREEHHRNLSAGYDEAVEQRLLASVDWKADGYRLFEISCFSGANPRGYFHPYLESNCMFASRKAFEEVGGADERFRLPGGGALNFHMYRQVALRPGTGLYVLPGEGSFHQFHGGVTTAEWDGRDELVARASEEANAIWGPDFVEVDLEPVLLGAVPGPALRFMEVSARMGLRRFYRESGRLDLARALDEADSPLAPGWPAGANQASR